MSAAYSVTIISLIVAPLGLLILYLIMSGTSCDTDNPPSNESQILKHSSSSIDNNYSTDCHVSGWSKWSNCTCLVDNYRYRRRILESNYNSTIHEIDPCADVDSMQYIKCQDSDCGKVDYCNQTIDYDSLIQISYHCNSNSQINSNSESSSSSSSNDNIIEFWYFDPNEFSCSMIKLKDCVNYEVVQNKFPSLNQCEKICFFQNYLIGDV